MDAFQKGITHSKSPFSTSMWKSNSGGALDMATDDNLEPINSWRDGFEKRTSALWHFPHCYVLLLRCRTHIQRFWYVLHTVLSGGCMEHCYFTCAMMYRPELCLNRDKRFNNHLKKESPLKTSKQQQKTAVLVSWNFCENCYWRLSIQTNGGPGVNVWRPDEGVELVTPSLGLEALGVAISQSWSIHSSLPGLARAPPPTPYSRT